MTTKLTHLPTAQGLPDIFHFCQCTDLQHSDVVQSPTNTPIYTGIIFGANLSVPHTLPCSSVPRPSKFPLLQPYYCRLRPLLLFRFLTLAQKKVRESANSPLLAIPVA
jgi:hypothetical protein